MGRAPPWSERNHSDCIGDSRLDGSRINGSTGSFSSDNSVRTFDESLQESLAECIARPPISRKKVRYEPLSESEVEVEINARGRGRARFLAKDYQIDPFVCPDCGAEIRVIAIIEDPHETGRILPIHGSAVGGRA